MPAFHQSVSSSWMPFLPPNQQHQSTEGLTVFSTISPSFLWSTSWPDTLHFILYIFLHPISVFFSQHTLVSSQPVEVAMIRAFAAKRRHLILISLNRLLGTRSCSLTPHIHLTILISVHCSATSFSFLKGQVSLQGNILLCTQLLCNLPLTINDVCLLVSNGINCLNLFHSI